MSRSAGSHIPLRRRRVPPSTALHSLWTAFQHAETAPEPLVFGRFAQPPLQVGRNRLEEVPTQKGEKGGPFFMEPQQHTAVLLDPHPLWLESVQSVLDSL